MQVTIIPVRFLTDAYSQMPVRSDGMDETMLQNRIMEIPLPISSFSRNSPRKMIKMPPTDQISVAARTVFQLYGSSRPRPPRPMAMEAAWRIPSTTPVILISRLYRSIPVLPSLRISSNAGNTTVRSWMIMDAVMYGLTDNAKNDICSIDPPVMELKNPSPSTFKSD